MSSEWELKKLSEVANFLNSKRIPLSSIEREKRKGSYPYYGASGVVDHIDDYIFDGTYLLISEDGENLRTRNTPIAFKAKGKFWVNNHAHILSEKQEGILDYLEYFFSVLDLSPYITGAVQPKLNKANLDSIEIPVPDENIRLKINAVLNSLTNKIELNNQINQTLEAMAQAIFKSWFVDFEPVKAKMAVLQAGGSQAEAELAAMMAISGKTAEQLSTMRTTQAEAYQQLTQTAALFPDAMQDSELGEIPEGWSLKTLGDICTFTQGSAFKNEHQGNTEGDYPFIKVSDMNLAGNEVFILKANNYVTEEQKKLMNAKVHPAGSTVFAKIGVALTSNRRRLLPIDTIIDNNLMSVSPIQGMSCSNYLYLTLINLDFNLLVSGTALPYLNVSDLRKIQHIYSSREIISRFESITSALFSQIKNNASQNLSLVNIRESLLPKLLSGELEV